MLLKTNFLEKSQKISCFIISCFKSIIELSFNAHFPLTSLHSFRYIYILLQSIPIHLKNDIPSTIRCNFISS